MTANNDPSSFQSALSAITEAAVGGGTVPSGAAKAALDFAPPVFQGPALDALVEALHTLDPLTNWDRFWWLEAQLDCDILPDSLHDKWKECCASLEATGNRMASAMAHLNHESDENEANIWTEIRAFETHLGFDEDLTRKICRPIALPDASSATIRLHQLLPQGLLPQNNHCIGDPQYDHALHLFMREILTRLGPAGRRLPQVIRACGRTIAELFPDKDTDSDKSVVFRQYLDCARGYLERHPNDILSLCWRGELACCEGNEDLAEKIALQVWKQTQDASPAITASLLWFFVLTHRTSFYWHSLGWINRSTIEGSFGEVRSDWFDREEELAIAVIRRAVVQGRWDREFLEAVATLNAESPYILTSDLLPAECWVWIAERSAAATYDDVARPYYLSWREAFEATAGERSSDISLLSSIVLLAGRILDLIDVHIELNRILERLESLVAHPQHGQASWRALGAVNDLLPQLPMRHLTSAERLALGTVWRKIANAWKETGDSVSEESADAARRAVRIVTYIDLLEQAEAKIRNHLGEKLWKGLHKTTQAFLLRGQTQYDQELELDGDKGDFGTAILHFSNALLNEIVLRFWRPMYENPSSRSDARKSYSGHGDPEWSYFVRLFGELAKDQWWSIVTVAQLRGIRVRTLIDACREFEFLRDEGRNKAPHREQIDREMAAVLYDKLIHKELMKSIFAALHR